MWRLVTFYIPLWIIYPYGVYVQVKVSGVLKKTMERVRRNSTADQIEASERFVKRVRYYPAALIVTWFFPSINRISQLGGKKCF